MVSHCGCRANLVALSLVVVAGASCRQEDNGGRAQTPAAGEAGTIVAALRARAGSPLAAGLAERYEARAKSLQPVFPATAASKTGTARVALPMNATVPLHLEDVASGTAVDVTLKDARPATAQTADGYVVYARAHASGATLLHRALPTGTEDYLAFDAKPTATEIAYDLALGEGARGLRLVANTLEVIDAGGAPRLRVTPPYIVGANGATMDATLAVDGCAVDTNPAAPWTRAVTTPGATHCGVRVTWPSTGVAYPAVLDPRWTTTGSMATARQDHSMTVLANGKALVTGGRSTSGTTGLASAELYDRTTGTWAATASMTGGRFLHRATQLNTGSNATTSGKVLISGGINGTSSVNTAQLYNPTAGTWAAAGNMNAARHAHTATLLVDGKVLVAGGLNGTTTLATAAVYNPATGSGTWTATGPIPPPGLKAHTATLIQTSNTQLKDKVLLVGGNSGSAAVSTVFLFDPGQSAFSTLGSPVESARATHGGHHGEWQDPRSRRQERIDRARNDGHVRPGIRPRELVVRRSDDVSAGRPHHDAAPGGHRGERPGAGYRGLIDRKQHTRDRRAIQQHHELMVGNGGTTRAGEGTHRHGPRQQHGADRRRPERLDRAQRRQPLRRIVWTRLHICDPVSVGLLRERCLLRQRLQQRLRHLQCAGLRRDVQAACERYGVSHGSRGWL